MYKHIIVDKLYLWLSEISLGLLGMFHHQRQTNHETHLPPEQYYYHHHLGPWGERDLVENDYVLPSGIKDCGHFKNRQLHYKKRALVERLPGQRRHPNRVLCYIHIIAKILIFRYVRLLYPGRISFQHAFLRLGVWHTKN